MPGHPPRPARCLVVLDADLPEAGRLAAGCPSGAEIIWLKPGIRLADALAGRKGITSLHLVGHGAPGRIVLGGAPLDRVALSRSPAGMAYLTAALAPGAEIVLYGCATGAGAQGRAFTTALAAATGARVAAAAGPVGAAARGGCWDLAFADGRPARPVFDAAARADWPGLLVDLRITRADGAAERTNAGTVAFEVQFLGAFTTDVTDVGPEDFTVTATGTATAGAPAVARIDADLFRVTVPGTGGDGTVALALAPDNAFDYTDLELGEFDDDPGTVLSGESYILDTTPPGLTLSVDDPVIDAGDVGQIYTIVVSSAEELVLDGVPALAFPTPGESLAELIGPVSAELVDAATVELTFQVLDPGAEVMLTGIDVAVASGISDVAGNAGVTDDSGTDLIDVDIAAQPTLVVSTQPLSPNPTNASEVIFRLVPAQIPVDGATVDLSDFVVTTTGTATGTLTAVEQSSFFFNYTVSGVSGDGTLAIDPAPGAEITVLAGNESRPIEMGSFRAVYDVDNTGPAVTIFTTQPLIDESDIGTAFQISAEADELIQLTPGFRAIFPTAGEDPSAILDPLDPVRFPGDQANARFTVLEPPANFTLSDIDVDVEGIVDLAGNPLRSVTGGEDLFDIDIEVAPPLPTVGLSTFGIPGFGDVTNEEQFDFRVTSTQPLVPASLEPEDLLLVREGTATGTITAVTPSGTGDEWLVTVEGVSGDGLVTFDVAPTGEVELEAGGLARPVQGPLQGSIEVDNTGPVVTVSVSDPLIDERFLVPPDPNVFGDLGPLFTIVMSGSEELREVPPFSQPVFSMPGDGVSALFQNIVRSASIEGGIRLERGYDIVQPVEPLFLEGVDVTVTNFFTDRAGNPATAVIPAIDAFDVALPGVAGTGVVFDILAAGPAVTNAGVLTFRVEPSREIDAAGVGPEDFTLATTGTAAGTIAGVVESGTAPQGFEVTVTVVSGEGEIGLDFAAADPGFRLPGGDPVTETVGADEVYTRDVTPPGAPTLALALASDTGAAGDGVTATALPAFEGVAPADAAAIELALGLVPLGLDAAPFAPGSVWSVPVPGSDPLPEGLNEIRAIAIDAAGNRGPASLLPVTIDLTPPRVTEIAPLTLTPTNADTLAFAVRFSEAVTGLDAGDFTLLVDATAVAGYDLALDQTAPDAVTVTVSDPAGGPPPAPLAGLDAEIGLAAVQSGGAAGFADIAGNPGLADPPPGAGTVVLDNTAPVLAAITRFLPQAEMVAGVGEVSFLLAFDEAVTGGAAEQVLATLDGATVGGFTVAIAEGPGGDPSTRIVTLSGSGFEDLEATLSLEIASGGAVAGAFRDLAGNLLAPDAPGVREGFGVDNTGRPPVAAGESLTLDEDAVTADLTSVLLANDTGSTPLSITAAGPAGTGSVQGPGLVYAASGFDFLAAGETATDSFSYTVANGSGADTATVTITVTGVNDAPVAADDLAGPGPGTGEAGGDVLANDTDADLSDTLSAALLAGPANGSVTLVPSGAFTYLRAPGFAGADSFTYRVSDGNGGADTGTVTIPALSGNAAPAAEDDAFTTAEDTPLSGDVTANDRDPDGDPLTVSLVAGPASGGLSFGPDGGFTYTPAADFAGADAFTYRVADGRGRSDIGTVALTVTPVNDPPVAATDRYVIRTDRLLEVPAPGVAVNDSDADGDPLAVALVTPPLKGSLALGPNGGFTYTPESGLAGTDFFVYAARDGRGGEDRASVTLTVAAPDPANAAPDALDDAVATEPGLPVAGNVLGNDTDPNGDPLTAMLTAPPENGQVVLAPDGRFTYTPAAGFTGTDGFSYAAADGRGGNATARVIVEVGDTPNAPPEATPDAATTAQGASVAGNVLANDTDRNGDPLTAALATQAANGTVTLAPDGTWSYAPDPGFAGVDRFAYTVSDGRGGNDTALATLTVTPVNAPPEPRDDAAATTDATPVPVAVLANDTDPDGDAVILLDADAESVAGARVTRMGDQLVYDPGTIFAGLAAGETATDSFAYRVRDEAAVRAAAVTVTVAGTDSRPVVLPETPVLGPDERFAVIPLLQNDGDPEGAPVTLAGPVLRTGVTVMGDPGGLSTAAALAGSYATARIDADGNFLYRRTGEYPELPAGTTLIETFAYTVSDGTRSETGTVTVTGHGAGEDDDLIAEGSALGERGSNDGRDARPAGGAGDLLEGGQGNDLIGGGSGEDTILGGPGRDMLYGEDDADIVEGEGEDDVLFGGGEGDTLLGGPGNDKLDGGAGDDLIDGQAGSDFLIGGTGDDTLIGGPGNEGMLGGPGDDRLLAGPGTDDILGGSGADAFVFAPGDGTNVIDDFEPGTDRLVLEGFSGLTPGGALTALTPTPEGALLLRSGTEILLTGVDPAALTEAEIELA